MAVYFTSKTYRESYHTVRGSLNGDPQKRDSARQFVFSDNHQFAPSSWHKYQTEDDSLVCGLYNMLTFDMLLAAILITAVF
ncbi:hypothetical protein SNOG_06151 [Parastagonospora nodorum SN15]|uniref:Uncharacterized protein n=1 Tax=Phaeosphaeria nodorum (strain SN15 / ATCC MYA-4574 / FGSC 10173) TaxID=321614 RepID=Q0UQ13_PHANO|nr:hypothetical protein SNOG_06151 [Parastagonospora nodorum SN15]EAT85982.1 hypothetical protein SNOG_06151 [Parastagonospora nodorum SN15]